MEFLCRLDSKSKKVLLTSFFAFYILAVFLKPFPLDSLPSPANSEKILNRIKYSLEGEWHFRQVGKETWYKAQTPGCVHTDLMDNGLIPDPFYRDNEIKVQWVEKEDWEYRKEFELPEKLLERNHIELVAKGLDTFTQVFLNGEKIAKTDNMFRGWRFDVKPFLKKGKNELKIYFESAVNKEKLLEEKLPYKLPGNSPHVRKAPYHFGWDWGPRLVTCGIWRPVYLEAWDKAFINELEIVQEFKIKDEVTIHIKPGMISDENQKFKIKVSVSGKKQIFTKSLSTFLKRGLNAREIPLKIKNPNLWWPNGLGEQNLYLVKVELFKGNQLLDSESKRIGIRTLVLEQKDDRWGKSFQFVVNRIPFFAKGGNWIPSDSFAPRVTRQKYEKLLRSCAEAKMNMLRVWGGGYYESPEFYDLCDELGLAIWQDFMFACALFPGGGEFLENVKNEADYVIKELRHHPSLALWCGNNECEEGWFHWGWKLQYPAKVWEDYEKIFHQILPDKVKELDPQRAYWPSSPHSEKIGDPRSPDSGDMHYWGIWHGKEPFEEYRKKFHRFFSEFGFQSFPLIETVKKYTLPQEWNIASPVMELHQKHPEGNRLILHYMLDHYRMPKDFESLLWLSEVLQAEGMKIGVEHFRSQMPCIMGSLYWQINDCWPVASWSGMDYYGNWKALHYYAKRFYNPILIAPVAHENNLNVYCLSDLTKPEKADFSWAVYTYDGEILSREKTTIQIGPGQSKIILTKSLEQLKNNFSDDKIYFYCELAQADKILSSNIYHFSKLKRVDLPQPEIKSEVTLQGNNIKIILEAAGFAKNVYLYAPEVKGRFSDNFFDIIPGKKYVLEFHPEGQPGLNQFKSNLHIISLRDSY